MNNVAQEMMFDSLNGGRIGSLTKGFQSKSPYMRNDENDPMIVNVGYHEKGFPLPQRKVMAKWSFVQTLADGMGLWKCRQTGELHEFKIKVRGKDED